MSCAMSRVVQWHNTNLMIDWLIDWLIFAIHYYNQYYARFTLSKVTWHIYGRGHEHCLVKRTWYLPTPRRWCFFIYLIIFLLFGAILPSCCHCINNNWQSTVMHCRSANNVNSLLTCRLHLFIRDIPVYIDIINADTYQYIDMVQVYGTYMHKGYYYYCCFYMSTNLDFYWLRCPLQYKRSPGWFQENLLNFKTVHGHGKDNVYQDDWRT